MTYLQIINAVLDRLRETRVTALDSNNAYLLMIGDFVNDAKRLVEAAGHEWTHLRTEETIALASGTDTYAIVGSGDSLFKMYNIWETTLPCELRRVSGGQMKEWKVIAGTTGTPQYYAYKGIDAATGRYNIQLHPTPDAVLSLDVTYWAAQDPLTDAEDILKVPSLPVVLLATAMAVKERGEVGNIQIQEVYDRADKALGDAISFDFGLTDEEKDWTP